MKKPSKITVCQNYFINHGLFFIVAVLFVLLSLCVERFFTSHNLLNILNQCSYIGIAACGMTFVLLTGGIDLSMGSLLCLAGFAGATYMQRGGDPIAGILIILGVSLLIGCINGVMVAWVKVVPFMATLVMMIFIKGLAIHWIKGVAAWNLPKSFQSLGHGMTPIIITGICLLVGHILLGRTMWGRYIYLTGANIKAARISGIPVDKVLFAVYVIAAFYAGLSTVVAVARINSAGPTAGDALILDVIAAVVIGGTSLFGGKGDLIGTLFGVLLIGMIQNSLNLLGIGVYWQIFAKGLIIFIAVFIDSMKYGGGS